MSIYKSKKAASFTYDFQIGGRRFSGSTGQTDKRKAAEVERTRKVEAKAEIEAAKKAKSAPMTLGVACHRYWQEAGQHQKRADNVEWSLAWLLKHLGRDTVLTTIGNDDVARIVSVRRGEKARNTSAGDKLALRLVSPARVNRSVTEPLRKVWLRARDLWEVQVRPIKWSKHILTEPRERIREMSAAEEIAIRKALPAWAHPVLDFALLTGFRISEVCGLTWDRIDWGGRVIRVLGKGDKEATIPLTTDLRVLLWPLQRAGEDFVFHYASGDRLTDEGLRTAWRRAREAARLPDLRFHDLRHTAGTRLLRSSGNLPVVAKLLRHENIATTKRYAHTTDDDLRLAMERAAAPSPMKSPRQRKVKQENKE